MLNVLILADKPGWVVDRVVDRLIKGIPCNFTKKYYSIISPQELLEISSNYDLVHYSNFDISYHLQVINDIKTPFLIGDRSHRWHDFVPNLKEIIRENKFYVQVLNESLLTDLPNAKYIPNGIFENFYPKKEFIVGFAGQPTEYKGFQMIQQACKELGVKFFPAIGQISPKKMPSYYRKINLLVSASLNEGHCNPVHECMRMNVPVITTETDAVINYNLVKVERSVEGIKNGILKFYTQPQVAHLTWEKVCNQFFDYYKEIVGNHHNSEN